MAGSLKLRLFLAAALAISLSLLIAGVSFYYIFERYVERQAIAELENHATQLIASIRIDETGKLRARTILSDPRFQRPYGGLYWQISEAEQQPLRSRSLFDHELPNLNSTLAISSAPTVHVIDGPDQTKLFASEREIVVPGLSSQARHLHLTMAIDRRDIDEVVSGFGKDLAKGLGLLYLVLLGASALQVSIGLRPLELLRQRVETIRLGTANRIDGKYPDEVRPLVEEMNGLLLARENQLTKARQRASNLAHGLKTPLTVMSSLATTIAAAGLKVEARDIQDGADHMHLLVERELARARMASGERVQPTNLLPVVSRVINALQKTSGKPELNWQCSIPDDALITMEPGDLLELTGNLLDNARKWAKGQIIVSWIDRVLQIEDDGPGVADDQHDKIQERGVRLDEKVSGTGLGLGIVRDLVEVYNFEMKLQRSSLGGLSVAIDTKSQALRMARPA
jgi:signal transduction histidine kinase